MPKNQNDAKNEGPAAQAEPQPPKTKKTKMEAFSRFKESIFGTAAILGMITLSMGFVLAALNSLTAPAVEKRLREEMEESIVGFFGEGVEFAYIELEDFDFAGPVAEAVAVYAKSPASQKLAGYCVTVTPRGFSGNMTMLVAVNANITVRDVKILEMSETAGIGTKIESESWFAEQFKLKSRNISEARSPGRAGDNAIDAISGATKSSRAFLAGVNAALDAAYEIKTQTAKTAETTAKGEIFDE